MNKYLEKPSEVVEGNLSHLEIEGDVWLALMGFFKGETRSIGTDLKDLKQ